MRIPPLQGGIFVFTNSRFFDKIYVSVSIDCIRKISQVMIVRMKYKGLMKYYEHFEIRNTAEIAAGG